MRGTALFVNLVTPSGRTTGGTVGLHITQAGATVNPPPPYGSGTPAPAMPACSHNPADWDKHAPRSTTNAWKPPLAAGTVSQLVSSWFQFRGLALARLLLEGGQHVGQGFEVGILANQGGDP